MVRLGPAALCRIGGSRAQVQEAIDALVRRAIQSGELRKDIEPFDLLRALIGVSNVASSPDWQQSASLISSSLARVRSDRFTEPPGEQHKNLTREWFVSPALRH